MKGEVYGIAAFSIRERKRQTFHSKNEAVSDMIEHLTDTFNSNATLLKGRIIKDGTSVILVSVHLTLLENAMKAKGDFGKEHPPINASVQKRAIQHILRYSTKSLKMIGSGTSYRFPPQAHDDQRDEERGLCIALDLLKLKILKDFSDATCTHDN